VNTNQKKTISRIDAVITSYNQGEMILQAVASLCRQTRMPSQIIIVDDGSTDSVSLSVLKQIEYSTDYPVHVYVHYQNNQGVAAARNTGIRMTNAPFVLVLDGDDSLNPDFVESVTALLHKNPKMVAASSWLQTFGVLNTVVKPDGGRISAFLSHNCCAASHILRRSAFDQCGGYDDTMQSGFEDWEYFIRMLETNMDAWIGIVAKPLINYRTAPASSNITSMKQRKKLMRYIIRKHQSSYQKYLTEALLGIEQIAEERMQGWEDEISNAVYHQNAVSVKTEQFLEHPSYGDGGMAAAVRIKSIK